MAGIIGIYGLVVSVLIADNLSMQIALFTGYIQLGSGLSVGLAGLAAGFAIGVVGDAGVRGTAQQPRLFIRMILILIFAEVLGTLAFAVGRKHKWLTESTNAFTFATGLYGLIVAFLMNTKATAGVVCHSA